jgi:hypothetical protein
MFFLLLHSPLNVFFSKICDNIENKKLDFRMLITNTQLDEEVLKLSFFEGGQL